ncbi:hypothetical protein AALB81_18330 [Lachnospiraceae bacterium 48-33]
MEEKQMYEQLDIFSYLQQQKIFKPGDWVEKDAVGKRLAFNEITKEVGNLIVIDKSTESHEWYKVVLVEKICIVEGNQRCLVYYDGKRQRGWINEMWFGEGAGYQERAWKLAV